ncbi:MAG TPA: hypothetical protein VLG13_01070 [Patescibacteria group bacterium]|nr:hypothetical protein [Patescibacteria group bacterium]
MFNVNEKYETNTINDPELRIPSEEEVASIDPSVRAEMAAAFLRGLEPGRQPRELFAEFCRLTTLSTVEVVPIREGAEGLEVWLDQRSEDDPWWPSKWTLPGVVILPTDARDDKNSLEGPIARLFEDELGGIQPIDELRELPSQFRDDSRGKEVTSQFWTRVETRDEPYSGRFFNIESLRAVPPEGGVLEESWLTIDRAVADYKAQQAQL